MYRGSGMKRVGDALRREWGAGTRWGSKVDTRRAQMSSETKLRYIPLKVKEEMEGLHEEDSSRWTATTLSARFSVPRENVEGLVKLWGLRVRRGGAADAERGAEEMEKVEKMREEMVAAWKQLPEVVERGGHRRGKGRLAKPSEMPKGEAGAVAKGEGGDGAKDAAKDAAKEAKEDEGEEDGVEKEVKVVVEKSETAKWIEERCKTAGVDVKRRTTFAFIEVGGKKGEVVERAVWIREGGSGKLRVADEVERKVLLEKVRVVDSGLWQ